MRYIFLLIWLLFACSEPKIQQVNLIPKPQSITLNKGVFLLGSSTGINIDSVFLVDAKYLKNLIKLPLKGNANSIILKQKKGLGEEEFFMNISVKELKIEATTSAGMMRGIQTLRQLLPITNGKIDTKIPCLKIHDFPRFSWRGMLLDCCRHFMTKEFVMRYIDLLAYHKMNVLHWHLTEDQGWRIKIDKYQNLTDIGAWRKEKDG